ncbi:MAG: C10 family peptidase [Prevotella sp.]|nr:C10 family peptidase [Prevotella sp.]
MPQYIFCICILLCPALTLSGQTTIKAYVEPLLTTAWGQDAPYYNMCPTKTNGSGEEQHCRVGCVACAMGQVMNYYQYPEVGKGSWTDIFNSAATANFGETHYDWTNMRDTYVGNYSDKEAEAVATLLYHCGVAVNMIYGLQSSSTFTSFANNLTTALTRYFGYESKGLRSVSRSQYTKEAWLQLIYETLSAGQPIIYSGNSTLMGGHTWVIDGYDEDGKLHMNWGWYGRSNGYYDIDLTEIGLDFNQKQSMIIGIRPPADANAINLPACSEKTSEIYTIDGRRCTSAGNLPKGIYIINKKKVIIK